MNGDKKNPHSSVPEQAHATNNSQAPHEEMTPEEAQAALNQVTSLFYSGKPKHAMSGAGEGLANLATGVSMGFAGLAGSTMVGSREGVWGGVKGFGSGLVGLAGLSGYGAYTGARQVYKGLCNTPEAVSEVSKGERYWDSNKEEWVKVELEKEYKDLPATDDDLKAKARTLYEDAVKDEKEKPDHVDGSAGKKPTEDTNTTAQTNETSTATPYPGMNEKGEVTDYYLFLGVDKNASKSEIKKAFTQKALVMHPDKNPDDPSATARFQQLLEVYNVLSNDVTRAEYDRVGHVDASNVEAADLNPIEEVLGVEHLKPLVGKLRFALYFEPNTLYDADMLKELHRRRRLRIAQNLCSYLDNEETGFNSATVALQDAVATRAGPQIVTFIAESYHVAARQHLYGNAWKRELDSWYSSKSTSLSTRMGLTASGARTAYRSARGKATEEDVLELLVAANEYDIRRTVLQGCRFALYDSCVSAEARKRRAERLDLLANLALDVARKELESRKATADAAAADASQPGAEAHEQHPSGG